MTQDKDKKNHTFCFKCGRKHRVKYTNLFPKVCHNKNCNHTMYLNPIPVAVVVCRVMNEGKEKLLVIKRNLNPGLGLWAFPGGFMDIETVPSALARELKEETGIDYKGTFSVLELLSIPSNKEVIMFYTNDDVISDFKFVNNEEVQGFKFIDSVEELAFSLHTHVLTKFFKGEYK